MKNSGVIAPIVALGIVLGLLTSAASQSIVPAQAKPSPTHVEKYSTSGKLAVAQWLSEDNDVYTEGFVYLLDVAKTPDGIPVSFVDVVILQYKLVEYCEVYEGEEFCYYDYEIISEFFGSAEVDKSDFRISNNIRSASIDNLLVTGYEFVSGNEMTITVDASWDGSGSPVKQRRMFSETTENYKIFFKGMLAGREAEASIEISGDIETTNEGDPENTSAFIAKAKESVIFRIYEEPI